MRTHKTRIDSAGQVTEEYLYSEKGQIPSYLEEELAAMNLVSITKRWKDGSEYTFTHLEYECEWCGEYGHGTVDFCPQFRDDVSKDDAIDDRSGTPGDPLR